MDQNAVGVVLDAGLSQVFTKYCDSGDTDSYTGLKAGEGLVWKISETAEVNEKVELTFIDSFDNKPVGLGVKKNDITLIAGISRKF